MSVYFYSKGEKVSKPKLKPDHAMKGTQTHNPAMIRTIQVGAPAPAGDTGAPTAEDYNELRNFILENIVLEMNVDDNKDMAATSDEALKSENDAEGPSKEAQVMDAGVEK